MTHSRLTHTLPAAEMPELAPFNAEHLIPRFVGVSAAAAPDAPPTMTIEDVTAGFRAPCVADIKMGTQTWQPGCSAAYRARKLAQDAQCTTAAYGFRFSGVCFPDATYGHDFGWHALADAQMLACLRAVLQCVPAPRWAAAVDAVRARVAAVRRAGCPQKSQSVVALFGITEMTRHGKRSHGVGVARLGSKDIPFHLPFVLLYCLWLRPPCGVFGVRKPRRLLPERDIGIRKRHIRK